MIKLRPFFFGLKKSHTQFIWVWLFLDAAILLS